MALPLTNLTLHADASDADNLFTTFEGDGSHSGTPVDGSDVQVWDNDNGIADVCLTFPVSAGQAPQWRSTTPLMQLPCLDFDGAADTLRAFSQDGGLVKAISNFIAADAFTILVAFRAESITDTGNHFDAHALLGDLGGFVGISLRDNAGQKVLQCWNWDGNADSVDLNINEGESYVVMFRHESGNLFASLNGGSESSVASGNTSDLSGQLCLGKTTLGSEFYNGRLGELAIYDAGLSGSNLSDAVSYFTDRWIDGGGGGGEGPPLGSLGLLGCGR